MTFAVGDLVRCKDEVTISQLEDIQISGDLAAEVIHLCGVILSIGNVCCVRFGDARLQFYLPQKMLTFACIKSHRSRIWIMEDTRDYLDAIATLGI